MKAAITTFQCALFTCFIFGIKEGNTFDIDAYCRMVAICVFSVFATAITEWRKPTFIDIPYTAAGAILAILTFNLIN